MPEFSQRLVKTTLEGEKIYETPRPEDNEKQLDIRMAKDAAIAQAMNRGAAAAEIMAIENSPDEEFLGTGKKAENKIVEFPKKRAA